MNREIYIAELKRHLSRLPEAEVRDIVTEYEDHFHAGKAAGKTDEQIALSLGQPKSVAQEFHVTSLVQKAEDSHGVMQKSEVLLRMLVAFVILAPLNFFILLGPFIAVVVCVAVGWIFPFVGVAIGLGLLWILVNGVGPLAFLTAGSVVLMSIGLFGMSVLGAILMFLVTKGVLMLMVRYAKWNLNFITARRA